MKTILTLVALIALLYGIAVLALFVFQRRLTYPTGTAAYYDAAATGLADLKEIKLETLDGTRLIAWWSPAVAGKPTLLYFHGNASALLNRLPRIERFSAAGYGVFMPAYRGYSGSGGSPSEELLIADSQLAYDYLRDAGINADDIVLYGESLGTGVAIQLAGLRPVAGIVLDAPYTSLPDVAKRAYSFAPVQTFMTERFESSRHIKQVDAPILVMHGALDQTIPIEVGRELFDLAPEPKRFVALKGAGHSNIYDFGAFRHLDEFLNTQLKRSRQNQLPESIAD
jgi:hypothetical protein